MDTINTLSVCMQGIISAGLLMRIIFCAVRLTHEEEESGRYRRRIKNSLVMLVIAQLIFPLKELLIFFFGSGFYGQHRTKTIYWILYVSCLHLSRHIAQFVLARRQPCRVLIVQSDEKSDYAIHAQSLCGIA